MFLYLILISDTMTTNRRQWNVTGLRRLWLSSVTLIIPVSSHLYEMNPPSEGNSLLWQLHILSASCSCQRTLRYLVCAWHTRFEHACVDCWVLVVISLFLEQWKAVRTVIRPSGFRGVVVPLRSELSVSHSSGFVSPRVPVLPVSWSDSVFSITGLSTR